MCNTIKYSLLFLIPFLFLAGCVEPFKPELEKNESEYILVVEGLLSNEPGSFEIKLSRSVPVDTTINSLPEHGAWVTVTDDKGTLYEFYESQNGIYRCTDPDAHAVNGRQYQLNIIDNQGVEYESSVVAMKPTPNIKEVYWEEVTQDKFVENEVFQEKGINIYVESEEPQSETFYYKWDFVETWKVEMNNYIKVEGGRDGVVEVFVNIPPEKKHCWVTHSSQSLLLKSVKQQETSSVDSFLVKNIPENNSLLHIRYSIDVKQYVLDKDAFQFWENIKELNDEIGTMYDHVPYSVYGNITCCNNDSKMVLGYFNVVEIKSKRIFIDKTDHHLPTMGYFDQCTYFGLANPFPFVQGYYAALPLCTDCRKSGTSVKPDFWE